MNLEQRYTKYLKENKVSKNADIQHFFDFLEKDDVLPKGSLKKTLEDMLILKVKSPELDDLKEKHGLGYL